MTDEHSLLLVKTSIIRLEFFKISNYSRATQWVGICHTFSGPDLRKKCPENSDIPFKPIKKEI